MVRLLLAAALVLPAAGCRKREVVADMDYDDPKAAIAAMESQERESWEMPDRIVRSLPIPGKDAVIADIGAGAGYFSRRLAAEVPAGTVYAVDIDDEFRSYIENNREDWGTPNIQPHLAFYDDPALPEKAIDLVFVANTYAYLRARVNYFKKVHNALKPGGHLVIVDFRPESTPPEKFAPEPKYRFSRDAIVGELAQAGFVLEREEEYLPHQYYLIFAKQP
ncbi:class I SAM-dependent methyltransferase [Nannocystis pusilla]|uniref:Class I SAM-dependent methyltransferase n=1 Tax=Nannocystis pusilla TaxID=889268 RepID=A0ABS7U1G3_9BACT|nr:class I SAM-dependent methyltransferase [Nannocystis pusilla]MBZ5714151.1 class I SAM-dependent methyltransferase [Nannocystis pusilla]